MTKKIYRIYNPGTEEYISEVHGMMRYEAYNKVDSAYAYDLQDALDILKHAKSMNKFIADNDEFPTKMREGCRQAPIIIPISINEVRISMDEATAAIDTAPTLGLSGEDAIRQARWRRVRKYKQYLHYSTRTPSHKYIYMHSSF